MPKFHGKVTEIEQRKNETLIVMKTEPRILEDSAKKLKARRVTVRVHTEKDQPVSSLLGAEVTAILKNNGSWHIVFTKKE